MTKFLTKPFTHKLSRIIYGEMDYKKYIKNKDTGYMIDIIDYAIVKMLQRADNLEKEKLINHDEDKIFNHYRCCPVSY